MNHRTRLTALKILGATCVVSVGLATAVAANGRSPVVRVEAEYADERSVGGTDGPGWNLWSNGRLGQHVSLRRSGSHLLTVRARGNSSSGRSPIMEVSVDGQPVGRAEVHVSRNWEFEDYLFTVEASAGRHLVVVAFINDSNGPEENLDLVIDWFELRPGPPAPEPSVIDPPATAAPPASVPTTSIPATGPSATSSPPRSVPTPPVPTTGPPTTGSPTTGSPTTGSPTTGSPTTGSPTTVPPNSEPPPGEPTTTTDRRPTTITRPASTRPASTRPASTQPTTTQTASTRPASTRPASTRPASTRPTTTQPTTTARPASTRPAPASGRSRHVPGGYSLTWHDEFDSLSLDLHGNGGQGWATNWVRWNVLSLAGNGDQCMKAHPDHTGTGGPRLGLPTHAVRNGVLTLYGRPIPQNRRSQFWGYQAACGMISGELSHSQTYGYWETRMRIPTVSQGHHWAIWLLPAGGDWPPEVDILEVVGSNATRNTDERRFHFTGHYDDGQGRHQADMAYRNAPRAADDWYTLGLEWTSDSVVWYLDGQEVHRMWNFVGTDPNYFLISPEIGGNWPGPTGAATRWPMTMEVDYVRIYSK